MFYNDTILAGREGREKVRRTISGDTLDLKRPISPEKVRRTQKKTADFSCY